MPHRKFAEKVVEQISKDENIIGLAAAGSWISNELDQYSDLDLVLITKEKIGGNKEKMLAFALSLGNFISGFTGEHVGEPRVLICLYDDPLLHVDIKFVTLPEFEKRIENPVILFERDHRLSELYKRTIPHWRQPDLQWIEDRFWTWVHYVITKLGRGEYFECIDALGMIRAWVLAPLLQLKNGNVPRGLRKLEMQLAPTDLESLQSTIPSYSKTSIITAMENSIRIYRSLRASFPKSIVLQNQAEEKAVRYFEESR